MVRYGPRISHLVAEIFDFDAATLSDGSLMRSVAEKIIHDLSLHLVEMFEGKFELGITVVAVISVSRGAAHVARVRVPASRPGFVRKADNRTGSDACRYHCGPAGQA